MRPRIAEILRDLFQTDLLLYVLPTGTTMYVLAMLAVLYVYVRRSERSGLSTYHALGSSVYGMAAGLMGARVFYLLETFDRTIEHPAVILDVFGPTTSWGAYLAGLTAYFAYFKLNKIPSSGYADAFGSSLGLGPFIGRWSCFLHGCCYGTVSEVPWAIRFPAGSPPYTDHFQHDWIATDSAFSLPVHPLQIYLSASALLVFWLSSRAFRVLKSAPGLTFLSYWFLYCLFRFPLEYVRADAARYGPLRFDLAQIVCLVACTAIAVVMTVRYPIRKAPTASGP